MLGNTPFHVERRFSFLLGLLGYCLLDLQPHCHGQKMFARLSPRVDTCRWCDLLRKTRDSSRVKTGISTLVRGASKFQAVFLFALFATSIPAAVRYMATLETCPRVRFTDKLTSDCNWPGDAFDKAAQGSQLAYTEMEDLTGQGGMIYIG
eukprot:s191_g8.t1